MPKKLSEPSTKFEPHSPQVVLARIIRQRRLDLNLSQEDLQDEHLTQSQISKIERATQSITLDAFIELSPKLKLEPQELLQLVLDGIAEYSKRRKRS